MNKSIIRGRFEKQVNEIARAFSASHEIDRKLYLFDIAGSKAHAKMLQSVGILNKKELEEILRGLDAIKGEIESGKFEFHDSLEDIHMHIESRLIELIGDTGKKLHTGRSRNDQVVLDFRLYSRYAIFEIIDLIEDLMKVLLKQAKAHENVFMPAYTHLQQAQGIRASQHFLAYINMFNRDREKLVETLSRVSEMPLGAGAIAGTGLGNDREMIARDLCFERITDNSMDTVADRDFALELLFDISMIALHLSRFAEEIIIWYSTEFNFVELDEAYCTGSSLMPQKSNPDMAELIRGKTGRFIGNLVNLFTTLKALPLAYNRDMQEDKEPVFDSVDSIKKVLSVFTGMLQTLKIKNDIIKRQKNDYMLATDVAEFLVKKGMPFRQAHETTGRIVRFAIQKSLNLSQISIDEYKKISSFIDNSIYDILDLKKSPDSKNTFGSTSLKDIRRQIKGWEKVLNK